MHPQDCQKLASQQWSHVFFSAWLYAAHFFNAKKRKDEAHATCNLKRNRKENQNAKKRTELFGEGSVGIFGDHYSGISTDREGIVARFLRNGVHFEFFSF